MSILIVPWLLLALLLLNIAVLLKRKWLASAIIFTFLITTNCYFRTVPLSFICSDNTRSIRVMTFNINGSEQDCLSIENVSRIIINENADIVFLVEDKYPSVLVKQKNILETFPYNSYNDATSGHYILSKYPIGASEHIDKETHSFLYHYSVAFNGDSIHLYGCHLATNNYTADNKSFRPDSIKEVRDAKQYLVNIEHASGKRIKEVDMLLQDIKPNNKNIILGDFNDICGSKPLRKIEESGFTDAWWKGGTGYGATIHYPFSYRIDHIYYNNRLKLKKIRKKDCKEISDHDALVAEFIMN